jgi:hypothetical protein
MAKTVGDARSDASGPQLIGVQVANLQALALHQIARPSRFGWACRSHPDYSHTRRRMLHSERDWANQYRQSE